MTIIILAISACLLITVLLFVFIRRKRVRDLMEIRDKIGKRNTAGSYGQEGQEGRFDKNRNMKDGTRKILNGIGFAFSVLALTALFLYIGFSVIDRVFEPYTHDYSLIPPSNPQLESKIDEFTSISDLMEDFSGGDISGKAVIIDITKKSLHPLNRSIPENLAAQDPEEVSIVVWVEAEYIHEFDLAPQSEVYQNQMAVQGPGMPYSYLLPAYMAKWNVKIIDFKDRTLRCSNTFTGDAPPGSKVTIGTPSGMDQAFVFVDGKKLEGAEILYGKKEGQEASGEESVIGIVGPVPYEETLDWIMSMIEKNNTGEYKQNKEHIVISGNNGLNQIPFSIDAGSDGIAALKTDGTVAASGNDKRKISEIQNWKDIIAVSAASVIVGLKSDGTVVQTEDVWHECDVSNWRNITAVSAGGFVNGHVVGLKSDGTVAATGNNRYGQCDVSGWLIATP